jgi:hypothetical protein
MEVFTLDIIKMDKEMELDFKFGKMGVFTMENL